MPNRSVRMDQLSRIQTFDLALPSLTIESIYKAADSNRLQLHTFSGNRFATVSTVTHRGRTYAPAPIAGCLAQAIRFPSDSRSFGSAPRLTTSMLEFLTRYAHLRPDVAALLVAFALASWFPDCIPAAPVLYLLGPANETQLVLRLLRSMCRRPILLGNIDMAAIATLPKGLNPTLLICERKLAPNVQRVLLASNSRYFRIAHGTGELHINGAKALSVDREPASDFGIRISLSPALDRLPVLSDADEEVATSEFQSKLLRYKMLHHSRVRDAQIDTEGVVPSMRDETRAWLAPICGCPDLLHSVRTSLALESRQLQEDRFTDDLHVSAEAALFFCHKPSVQHFFVGDFAQQVNLLLQGGHETHLVTPKMAGSLLRKLGIRGERFTAGYRIELSDGVRQQIHDIARSYQVFSTLDGIARCRHCLFRHNKGPGE